jgi:hypothetical protein
MAEEERRPPGLEGLPLAAATTMTVNRYRLTQVIYVVARLGLADLLADGPRDAATLASICGAHEGALFRVLRAAAGVGIFRQDDDGRFENTPLSAPLRSDAVLSLRPAALLLGEQWYWQLWGELLETVRSGRPALPRLAGAGLRDWMAGQPRMAVIFRAAIDAILRLDALAVLGLYDFNGCRRVVYPGFAGGYLSLVGPLLRKYHALRLALLDFPENLPTARANLKSAELDRCRLIAGTPESPLPVGADLHVWRHCLSHFGDEEALTLLRRSHEALAGGGRLVVVAMLVAGPNEFNLGKLLDLEAMLVSEGGRERTEAEYEALLARAGFRTRRTLRSAGPTGVIEAEKI